MLKPQTLKKRKFLRKQFARQTENQTSEKNKNRDNGNDTSSTLVNVKDAVSVVSIGKSCSPLFALKHLYSTGHLII